MIRAGSSNSPSWDGNHARPILKGRSLALSPDATSNMNCQTKFLNATIVCSHGGSHTQCIRVTNLKRINSLADLNISRVIMATQIRRHGQSTKCILVDQFHLCR